MRTNVQNEKSIRIGSWVLRKGGKNLGLFDKGTLEVNMSTLNVRASNGFLPPRQRIDKISFSAELYEIDFANFSKFSSVGETEKRNAGNRTITGEVMQKTGKINIGDKITLADSNSVLATNITIKHGSANVPNSDYSTKIEDGKVVVIFTKAITLTSPITADYTVADKEAIIYTIRDVIKAIDLEELTFEQVDGDGKRWKITIPRGYNTENIKLEIGHNDKLDEVMKLPISIEAYPDENGRLLIIEDEQAI